MRETICTIPVNEIFEQTGGCPICRMRDIIESKYVEYITGPAMMEPDIRIMTNEKGFCERHLGQMLEQPSKRLPICLTLESHIIEIGERLLADTGAKSVKKLAELEESCFVCDYLERHLARALDTLFRSYRDDEGFRKLFASQERLCLPHYRRLIAGGKPVLGKQYKAFCAQANALCRSQNDLLLSQLQAFRDAYDYRNAGQPMPESSRDCINRTFEHLTSRQPRAK